MRPQAAWALDRVLSHLASPSHLRVSFRLPMRSCDTFRPQASFQSTPLVQFKRSSPVPFPPCPHPLITFIRASAAVAHHILSPYGSPSRPIVAAHLLTSPLFITKVLEKTSLSAFSLFSFSRPSAPLVYLRCCLPRDPLSLSQAHRHGTTSSLEPSLIYVIRSLSDRLPKHPLSVSSIYSSQSR